MGDKLLISLDSGTTSSRVLIYNLESGKIEHNCQKEIKQIYPNSGWMEESAEEIYNTAISCMKEAMNAIIKNGFKSENIKGIGITNQRETTVVWDKSTGKPLYNAILWSDTRTHEIVEKMIKLSPEKNANSFLKTVGLPLSTYFSALKLYWLLQEVKEVKLALKNGNLLFGTVDCWLIWKLTGGVNHVTDVTNASRTMLMNLSTLNWDDDMCKFFSIDKSILPKIISSAELFGVVKLDEKNNKLNGLKITGVLGDQQASLVGQNCVSFGQTKCTYGTGAFLLTNIGENLQFSNKGLLTTVAYQFGSKSKATYAYEGSIPVAAGALNWLRDNLGIFKSLDEDLNKMVMSVPDNGGCYFVPAFNGLFCPYWRSDARGVIVGLSQTITKNHLCRATLESIAFQTKEILNAMKSDNDKTLKINSFKIDGGVANNNCFNQILADICAITVDKAESVEATALGAAVAAAHGLGLRVDKMLNQPSISFKPKLSKDILDKMFKEWKRAVTKSFN